MGTFTNPWYLGWEDFKQSGDFAKACLAEFIGTMFLVFIGCGTASSSSSPLGVNVVAIALAFGLSAAALAYTIGHVSGCHINPAVSLGLFCAGQIGLFRALIYMFSQFMGALAGYGILKVNSFLEF